ncbi:MAG: hypothetical protein ACOVP4_08745 [Bacteriovoracaceae bacterium]|jgi:hypothetical protein
MKFPILVAFFCYSTVSMAALKCSEIEKKLDDDGNITYFSEIKNYKINLSSQKKMIRMAVADYYDKCGPTTDDEYCYRPEMNHKEVVELGEEAFTVAYKTPDERIYFAVNVGFGGGNSALYFFSPDKLKMEKVMIIDGADCNPIKSILGHN